MNSQLQAILRQLSITQRLGIIGAALASAALLAVFVMFASKPDYTTAFTQLTPADAGAIGAALRSANVPFQVTDAGTTIMVPVSSLSDARVAAAQAGVTTTGSSGKGFELFDQSGFGMSDFDQQVTYQRAIEGELTRTIEAMNGVATARVAVVMAQKGVLADQDTPASASVMLTMRSGQTPSSGLVQAIVSTVSGAVAGLATDKVVVTDDKGHTLAGGDDAGSTGAQAQAAIEGNLEGKVQGLVAQALGAGHASVAVTANVDMNKVEQEITTYTPVTDRNYTPVSVHTVTETYSGTGAEGAGGIPGALSNIPGVSTYPGSLPQATAAPSTSPGASASPTPSGSPSPSASPTAAGNYLHAEQTVNYNLSQTVQHVVQTPGVIKKLSVAVLVDQASLGSVTVDALKTSIQAAIGADATRGDVVAVNAVPFAKTTATVAASSGPDMMSQLSGMVGTAIGIVFAMVMLLLFWLNNRALRKRADEFALDLGPMSAGLLQPGAASHGLETPVAEMPEPTPQARIQERLKMVAEEKPDALVGLMHGWLREEDRRR